MFRTLRRLSALLLALFLLLPTAPATAASVSSPLTFPTTNGDVLATTLLDFGSYRALALGGNFTAIRMPDGAQITARNLAVLRIPDGAVLYAGNANSYVRALYANDSRLYIAGSFTSLDGKPRNRIASVTAPGWQVTPFNPASAGTTYAVTATSRGVVYAGSSSIRSATRDTATVRWSLPVSGGPVRALAVYHGQVPGFDLIYAGGLFERVGDFTHHGLDQVWEGGGEPMVNHSFAPIFRPDSGVGDKGSWDGEGPLTLTWQDPAAGDALLVGFGGFPDNGVRAVSPWSAWTWWSTPTDGDVQAVATVRGDVLAGWHRGHVTYFGWSSWFGGSLRVADGQRTGWDPRLVGNVGTNADGNNGGISTLTYSPADGLLFAGGAFAGVGDCPTTVYPCTAAVTPLRSLAAWRY